MQLRHTALHLDLQCTLKPADKGHKADPSGSWLTSRLLSGDWIPSTHFPHTPSFTETEIHSTQVTSPHAPGWRQRQRRTPSRPVMTPNNPAQTLGSSRSLAVTTQAANSPGEGGLGAAKGTPAPAPASLSALSHPTLQCGIRILSTTLLRYYTPRRQVASHTANLCRSRMLASGELRPYRNSKNQ